MYSYRNMRVKVAYDNFDDKRIYDDDDDDGLPVSAHTHLGAILLPEPGRSGCVKGSTLTPSPDAHGRTRP